MIPESSFSVFGAYSRAWELALWCAAIITLSVVFGVGMMLLRYWLRRSPRGGAARMFSIGRLEKMRRSGQISEEEFKALRRATFGLDANAPQADNTSVGFTARSRPNQANR